MEKLIELQVTKIPVSSHVLTYDKPNVVYIPLLKDATVLIKKNTILDIGSPLYKTKNTVITSPISGIFTGYKKIHTLNNTEYALEILNNFEEQKKLKPTTRLLKDLKKDQITKLLNLEFHLDFTNIKNLILNAIDDDPYVYTLNFYLLLYYEGFLEILDTFSSIFNLNKIIICVKETSGENINKLMECLGMYPNIELAIVPNLYLLGVNDFLLEYLKYSNEDTLCIKTDTMYDIYNLIKRNRQKTDKLITINGLALSNPSIIKVKIGTLLKDVLKLINITCDNYLLIGNSIMNGTVINEDFIIDNALDSVLIMPDKHLNKEETCIHCGACTEICPVNINPLLLKDKKYQEQVKYKCLKCGLCSYICPVYINFNKYLKGDSYE